MQSLKLDSKPFRQRRIERASLRIVFFACLFPLF